MTTAPVARERRHTLHFLRAVRPAAPVYLDIEVDMGGVLRHRETARKYSLVAYVLRTAGRVLANHPEANAAISGGPWPRVARYPSVTGKLTLDRTLNGHRVVLAALLPDLDTAGLDRIQDEIDRIRDADPRTAPEFAGARLLHRLPWPAGSLLYRAVTGPLGRRPAVFGTVAVTSLGHRPVDAFHSYGGTAVTLGVGRVADRPVVRDGAVAVAPVMRLSLTFDHRVIDGAEAADVLAEIKDGLEAVSP
ncbi:2-oxo acid dehydrogenase subunit E2 [Actinomadura geliboluensis]|uniref:2-oxo acid dehydrogenase subunit E2 n=1 Tax=Actinomadura geliboluensis TaxID=882440 RepID=A0A5S4H9E0_9ACTN|nr:2-oxo acid dehydrogenase subunit E2 [Actinomadura geliboluensis]TMR41767.1 2-oxo acid dehydrogenase subunit E2 [Actinomadura geliboluensis]